MGTGSGSSCEQQFQFGQRYLVYAMRQGFRFYTTACMGSRLLSEARQDLAYLEAWKQGRSTMEVFGGVLPVPRGSDRDQQRDLRAMQSAVVRIEGPDGRSRIANLDRQLEYSVAVPEPGHYRIPAVLANWMAERSPRIVDLPPRGCAGAVFWMHPNGEVIGEAIESNGSPAMGVLLKLVPSVDFHQTLETRTDERGRFHFTGVSRGSYVLGVNAEHRGDPSPRVPYAPAFHPGVRHESQATIIRVPEFGRVTLQVPLRLPPRASPRTIRVIVAWDNGRPLDGASVSCTPEGWDYWQKNLTDASGVVTFSAMDNVDYIVDADIPSDHPSVNSTLQRAQWVRVGPGQGTTDLRIVFRKR